MLPGGRKSFKIGLSVLIQYRRVSDSQPASHVAVASTRISASRSKNCAVNTNIAYVFLQNVLSKQASRTHKTSQIRSLWVSLYGVLEIATICTNIIMLDACLPRNAMRKRGLCCRSVSICQSLCLYVRHVGVLYPDGWRYRLIFLGPVGPSP